MRWRRPGLRAQFVLALVATSARDARRGRGHARAAARAPPGHRSPARHARAGAHRATSGWRGCRAATCAAARSARSAVVRELARRMGGRVALFDAHGIELADTDPERREPRSATPERLVDAGFARRATSATR